MSAQLTLFPLQYLRQEAVPVDKDSVFTTTADRMAYLTSPRRYPGQIVSDLELQKLFILSTDRSSWKGVDASVPDNKYILNQNADPSIVQSSASINIDGGIKSGSIQILTPNGNGTGTRYWKFAGGTDFVDINTQGKLFLSAQTNTGVYHNLLQFRTGGGAIAWNGPNNDAPGFLVKDFNYTTNPFTAYYLGGKNGKGLLGYLDSGSDAYNYINLGIDALSWDIAGNVNVVQPTAVLSMYKTSLYATTDQSTNYERLTTVFAPNANQNLAYFNIDTENAGTGLKRRIAFGKGDVPALSTGTSPANYTLINTNTGIEPNVLGYGISTTKTGLNSTGVTGIQANVKSGITVTPTLTQSLVALRGVAFVSAANTSNWPAFSSFHPNITGVSSLVGQEAGATGTISKISAYFGTITGGGATIDQANILDLTFGHVGIINYAVGVRITDLNAATNNTFVLMNQGDSTTPPTGNWGIFNATAYNNNMGAGNTIIGSASPVDNGAKLQVIGKATVSETPTDPTDVVRLEDLSSFGAVSLQATTDVGHTSTNPITITGNNYPGYSNEKGLTINTSFGDGGGNGTLSYRFGNQGDGDDYGQVSINLQNSVVSNSIEISAGGTELTIYSLNDTVFLGTVGVFTGRVQGVSAINPKEFVTLDQLPSAVSTLDQVLTQGNTSSLGIELHDTSFTDITSNYSPQGFNLYDIDNTNPNTLIYTVDINRTGLTIGGGVQDFNGGIKVIPDNSGQVDILIGRGMDTEGVFQGWSLTKDYKAKWFDGIGHDGISYSEDVSAKNTTNPRWIPDKGYVDSKIPTVSSSSYTPTMTAGTNVSLVLPAICYYTKINDLVTVTGNIGFQCSTTGGTQSLFSVSLPIASNLGGIHDLSGVFNNQNAGFGIITGDSTNDVALFQVYTNSAVNQQAVFSFTYRVI